MITTRALLLGAALPLVAACPQKSAPEPTPGTAKVAPKAKPPAKKPPTKKPPEATSPASGGCRLGVEALPAPELHPELLAVAPQYFHPNHRGGFDAHKRPGRFPFFELADLSKPLTPPRATRITATTKSMLFTIGVGSKAEATARRDRQREVLWRGLGSYVTSAAEGKAGEIWALTRHALGVRLLHIAPGQPVRLRTLPLPKRHHEAQLVVSAQGRAALVWRDRQKDTLRLLLSWTLDPQKAIVLDQVTLPKAVANLAEITSTRLGAAPHGKDRVAVAWRPIVDKNLREVGSPSNPPGKAALAEVRWLVVGPRGPKHTPHRHLTKALPLGGTSGIGPWPLSGNGLSAGQLGEQAVFVWVDPKGIMGVMAKHQDAVRLAAIGRPPLVALRRLAKAGAKSSEDQLLLLDSSPKVRAFRLRCN